MTRPPRLRVIGPGRAGRSLASALDRADWVVHPVLGRADDVSRALDDVDLLVIATPDGAIGSPATANHAPDANRWAPMSASGSETSGWIAATRR